MLWIEYFITELVNNSEYCFRLQSKIAQEKYMESFMNMDVNDCGIKNNVLYMHLV